MITTTSSSLLSSKFLEALLLLQMVLDMAMVRHLHTVKGKLMAKMDMVVIIQVQLNLDMASLHLTLVLDMTSSKDIILPMAMYPTQHLMGTPHPMEHRVKPIKHLQLVSHTMLEVNQCLLPIIHLKLPPSQEVMEYPHLHKWVMVPKHRSAMAVMDHLRLKNHLVPSQLTPSHSSPLVLKVVAILSPGILIPRPLQVSLAMLRGIIQVPKDLRHQVIQCLSQGMGPRLMGHLRQLNLATGNTSLPNTTVLMVVGIHNLKLTLLMELPVVVHVAHMTPLPLKLPSPVEPLPRHHPPVDELSDTRNCCCGPSIVCF